MLDSRDMRQEGSTRQKGRMTVWMQDRREAGHDGYRTRGTQDRRDQGQVFKKNRLKLIFRKLLVFSIFRTFMELL